MSDLQGPEEHRVKPDERDALADPLTELIVRAESAETLLREAARLLNVRGDALDLASWQERRRQIGEELVLSDARWDFLQSIFWDTPCESPGRYGADCGACTRCRAIYRDGALRPDLRCDCDHRGFGSQLSPLMRPDFHTYDCPAKARPLPASALAAPRS